MDQPVPASITSLPLTTDTGEATTLAAFHGKIVVLADFMTLCQETCPLTTANLLQMDKAVTAAGLADRVQFVELTVDAARDTPVRLAAYRKVISGPDNLSLLTGTQATVDAIWQYFGVWYKKVPEKDPPGTDWQTGQPLTYDVEHQDVLVYLNEQGLQRFLLIGAPNATGAPLAPALRTFLNDEGRENLENPDASTWTADQALTVVAWLTGHHLKLPS